MTNEEREQMRADVKANAIAFWDKQRAIWPSQCEYYVGIDASGAKLGEIVNWHRLPDLFAIATPEGFVKSERTTEEGLKQSHFIECQGEGFSVYHPPQDA